MEAVCRLKPATRYSLWKSCALPPTSARQLFSLAPLTTVSGHCKQIKFRWTRSSLLVSSIASILGVNVEGHSL